MLSIYIASVINLFSCLLHSSQISTASARDKGVSQHGLNPIPTVKEDLNA